ncbi:hypothetical protein NAI44_09280, partial [Francisella tularensis subsp. holarctica]|uniref:hypothetical protein n=1 Tax=Francisella tularensis TaxID=263 RepID=UPI002381AB11
ILIGIDRNRPTTTFLTISAGFGPAVNHCDNRHGYIIISIRELPLTCIQTTVRHSNRRIVLEIARIVIAGFV